LNLKELFKQQDFEEDISKHFSFKPAHIKQACLNSRIQDEEMHSENIFKVSSKNKKECF